MKSLLQQCYQSGNNITSALQWITMLWLCQAKQHWHLCCPYIANTFTFVGCKTKMKVITFGKKNNSAQCPESRHVEHVLAKPAPCQWSGISALDQPPWHHFPAIASKAQFLSLQWPEKSRCTWHLLSSQQSLNITLRRPKEEARKDCGQGKRRFGRCASHLVLCLFGERNADTNQALGFSSRCESCMQICLLFPLLAVYIFHTKAIHIYKGLEFTSSERMGW